MTTQETARRELPSSSRFSGATAKDEKQKPAQWSRAQHQASYGAEKFQFAERKPGQYQYPGYINFNNLNLPAKEAHKQNFKEQVKDKRRSNLMSNEN